jgi:hypothetical protein
VLHRASKSKEETAYVNAVDAVFRDPAVRMLLDKGKPIAEREHVELFLKAVNAAKLSENEWVALATGTRFRSGGEPGWLDPQLRKATADMLAVYVEIYGESPMVAEAAVKGAERQMHGSVVVIPHQTGNRIFAATYLGAWHYAHWLLLKKFGRELCRCQHCGKFFLLEKAPRGRHRRRYCKPAHRIDRHSGTAARDRVRAYRAGMSIKEWRKLHPEESSK